MGGAVTGSNRFTFDFALCILVSASQFVRALTDQDYETTTD
jgi:hypothetical protein